MDLNATILALTNRLPGIKQAREAEKLSETPGDMTVYPGGQQDALRHSLWTARMAQDYGKYPALLAGGVHEGIGAVKNMFEKNPVERQRVWDETMMDLSNNASGAQFGASNPNMTPDALVAALRRQALTSLPPRR